jgi:hypothetical protein
LPREGAYLIATDLLGLGLPVWQSADLPLP